MKRRKRDVQHGRVVVGNCDRWYLLFANACELPWKGYAETYGIYEPRRPTCVLCIVVVGERFRDYEDYRVNVVKRHDPDERVSQLDKYRKRRRS